MIQKLEISGIHSTLDSDIHKYVEKKIGKLDKYLPKYARESVHVEVKLKEAKAKNKKQCTCEVIMYLPHGEITTKETTMNMFAAVDIVETKLKNQIRKYKEKHGSPHIARRMMAKIKRRAA